MFNWLNTRLKRYAVKQRRSFLEAEFHKNTRNPFQKVLVGLELITEPLEYNGATFVPLSVRGKLELRIENFDTLYERLQFYIREYTRVANGSSQTWIALPDELDKKKDDTQLRWIDQYFGTTNPEVVRDKLRKAFALIDYYRPAFTERDTPEQDALANMTAHIFRELETVVEHYL